MSIRYYVVCPKKWYGTNKKWYGKWYEIQKKWYGIGSVPLERKENFYIVTKHNNPYFNVMPIKILEKFSEKVLTG